MKRNDHKDGSHCASPNPDSWQRGDEAPHRYPYYADEKRVMPWHRPYARAQESNHA